MGPAVNVDLPQQRSTPERAARSTGTVRFAARQSMRWVGFYSGLVNSEAAERRRGEIASDLWEQQSSATQENPRAQWVGLSIAGRTVAGMAADISWVHVQRAAARRGPSPRPADLAHGLTRFAFRWWWALGALPIALAYLLIARAIWDEPGRPYGDQLFLVLPAAASLVVGPALRSRRPRASAMLVIIGAIPAFIAWWTPALLAAATLVVIGSVTELGHLTTGGGTGRNVALVAMVVLAGAMVAPFALGFSLVWVALAAGALLALVLTARRPNPAAELP